MPQWDFLDFLARAAKKDPKVFLEELIGASRHVDLTALGVKDWNYGKDKALYPLDTARMRHVLDLAASKAGWGRALPKGHALGVAVRETIALLRTPLQQPLRQPVSSVYAGIQEE